MAIPYFSTASKTREQFQASGDDVQAAAAAARDAHAQRAAEAADAEAAAEAMEEDGVEGEE